MDEIIWSKSALSDLKSIFDYIALDSVNYAERHVNKLIERTEVLVEFPKTGRVVPEKEDITIRELIEGNYRIFYKISSPQKITIIRIHHSAKKIH